MGKYALIIITLAFNVGGGYFAKLSSLAARPSLVYVALSILCYGSGFVFYILALRQIPLFVAQSLLSLQYVMMILLSLVIFHETIAVMQWAGMGLIFVGLLLVVTH